MPEEYGKSETIRQADELIARLKSHSFRTYSDEDFVEIYIEDDQSAGAGESIQQKSAATLPPTDKKRELFLEMRRLDQTLGFTSYGNKLQTVLFYKQAKFMESFEDDYEGNAPFSMYYPTYQLMSYEQLRTYFSWRTRVRKGVINETSYSYVFVYLYELINNIGVKNCEEGLEKLLFLWDEYRKYEPKLDKYMTEWVKDYYITNDFSEPFEEFLQRNETLQKLYQRTSPKSFFDFYYPFSNYKVKQSAFYKPETAKLIIGCFNYVIKTLDDFMTGLGSSFDDLIFYDSKGNTWVPFSRGLYSFYSREMKNRTVRISDTEKYRYENGRWTSSKNRVYRENGRCIIGYTLKRIEQFYRKATKYKYKLTADPKKIVLSEIGRHIPEPESLFHRIDSAILEYYRNSQRKVITVDREKLEEIRTNAQLIQERLLADTEEIQENGISFEDGIFSEDVSQPEPPAAEPAENEKPRPPEEPKPEPIAESQDIWNVFARSLTPVEKTAVRVVLQSASGKDLYALSKTSGIMPEVLVDNINQKAIETVNDNIMDFSDEITVFDEYKDVLERVISIECE